MQVYASGPKRSRPGVRRPPLKSRILFRLGRFLAVLACLIPVLAAAQGDYRSFGKEQIDQLTGQVALFPGALLSQVLMAATYPADVAAAAWSRAKPDDRGDAAVTLVDDQPWDPSVQSLVAFPQVIVMMGENPTWVKDRGEAKGATGRPVPLLAEFLLNRAEAATG